MHLVKRITVSIALGAFAALGCAAHGPLSPEDAFARLTTAYARSDAAALEALLSSDSKKKISTIVQSITRMDEAQRRALSTRLEIDPSHLATLTVRGYLALQFSKGDRLGADVYREAVRHPILRTEKSGTRAVVTASNGMGIVFVKEGRYWLLDISDY
ncbi:MAG TPA: hypothetical protein PKM65_14595 [Spirochaetota bacterium]|nr:hypothetical protein [Spirochaetota bacterium]HNT10535.1 hypothetical protein [Spirochaetota bacterium]HPI23274.1 hypothetical protein [Spirochaetota bacterium]HPU89824.1 hypothetical protein [Spirochaetota bacterium]